MAVNQESILNSIKKLIGIETTETVFDDEIKIHINTVLTNLIQMGIGPLGGFSIESSTEKWENFIPSDQSLFLQQIKTYVYIRVKLLFDPPTNSSLLKSLEEQAKELEVRMYTQVGEY